MENNAYNVYVLTNFQVLIPLYSDSDAFTFTQVTSPSFGLLVTRINTEENYYYQIELLQSNGGAEEVISNGLEWAKRAPHLLQKNQSTSNIEAIACRLRILAGLFDFRRNKYRSIRFVVRCFSNDVLLSTGFSPLCKLLAKKRIADNEANDNSNVVIPIHWMLDSADHINQLEPQLQLSDQSHSPNEFYDEDSVMVNMNDSEENNQCHSNEADSDELSLLPISHANYGLAEQEQVNVNDNADHYMVLYNGNAEVIGNFRALNFYKASDINIKEDVRLLIDDHDPRSVLLKIDGVEYKFKQGATNAPLNKRFVGYIAQQIESVVPEAVQLIDGILHVDYESLIPYLSESIKQNFRDISDMKADANQIHQVVDMMYAEFIKIERKKSDRKSQKNSKEPTSNRSLRWIIGTSLAVVLLISVALGVFLITPLVHGNNNQPSSEAPSPSSTPTPTTSPSPVQAPLSTSPIQPPSPKTFPSVDQQVLMDLYNATGGESWIKVDASPEISVCKWIGVTCNKEFRVTAIDMPQSNLEGTLPDSIGQLSELISLRLPLNMLYGTIPASIGNLTKLEEFHMFDTRFTGSVPLEIFLLPSLQFLNLDSNSGLSWTIPPQIGNLKQLKVFSAYQSGLHGTLPDEISQLTNLTFLSIGNNNITGTVPSLANTSMELLYLQNNMFTGPAPKMNEDNHFVMEIHLANNNFDGEFYLPEIVWQHLSMLYISDNKFTSVSPIPNWNETTAPQPLCQATNNPFKCPIPDWFMKRCEATCT